jgi:triphosphoribosyl-dephospho-CoA synthase
LARRRATKREQPVGKLPRHRAIARPRRRSAEPRRVRLTPEAVAAAAQIACLVEVQAVKPGNVSRGRDLPGLTYRDFVLSATCIGPSFRRASGRADRAGVGRLILDAVRATRRHVKTNTNLGVILLLAPLASAALSRGRGPLRDRLRRALRGLTVADARLAYQAIRLARPGGLGNVGDQDLSRPPTRTLLDCMRLAAGRDAIAREYATDFETTFTVGLPTLRALRARHLPLPDAATQTYLTLLASQPDTLIARKRGAAQARKVSVMARRVLEAGGLLTPRGRKMVEALDRRLRRPRPPLNPGATADLTVAALFLSLLEEFGVSGR